MRVRNVLIIGALLFMGVCFSIIALLCYVGYKTWHPEWTKEAELVGPDGYTYSFMNMSFFQGQTMLLVREKSGHPDSYEELGSNNGDFPRSWASVIRPAGADDDDYGQLYLSADNVIVGIRTGNKCFFAYAVEDRVFYGHGAIEETSPFVLLGAETKLHEPDVLATIFSMVEARHGHHEKIDLPGCPRPDTLEAGLKHPNEEVQKLSRWLLEVQQNGLAQPSDTIGDIVSYVIKKIDSSKSSVRKHAVRIAGYLESPGAETAVPALERTLHDEEWDISSDAAISLGRLGRVAFPVLSKCLKSEDSSIRFYGLLGYRIAGPSAATQVKEIVPLLRDEKTSVRSQAVTALKEIQCYDEELRVTYKELTRSRDSMVKEYAESALQQIKLKGLDHGDKE